MVDEHECTPPDVGAANLMWICRCGARWESYPANETPTWRLLTGNDDGYAWRRGTEFR